MPYSTHSNDQKRAHERAVAELIAGQLHDRLGQESKRRMRHSADGIDPHLVRHDDVGAARVGSAVIPDERDASRVIHRLPDILRMEALRSRAHCPRERPFSHVATKIGAPR
jgi:nucleotidyltransferase/DNA polymerase involved in DNA repair